MRWSDVFALAIHRKQGRSRSKTVAADQMIWVGLYRNVVVQVGAFNVVRRFCGH